MLVICKRWWGVALLKRPPSQLPVRRLLNRSLAGGYFGRQLCCEQFFITQVAARPCGVHFQRRRHVPNRSRRRWHRQRGDQRDFLRRAIGSYHFHRGHHVGVVGTDDQQIRYPFYSVTIEMQCDVDVCQLLFGLPHFVA